MIGVGAFFECRCVPPDLSLRARGEKETLGAARRLLKVHGRVCAAIGLAPATRFRLGLQTRRLSQVTVNLTSDFEPSTDPHPFATDALDEDLVVGGLALPGCAGA